MVVRLKLSVAERTACYSLFVQENVQSKNGRELSRTYDKLLAQLKQHPEVRNTSLALLQEAQLMTLRRNHKALARQFSFEKREDGEFLLDADERKVLKIPDGTSLGRCELLKAAYEYDLKVESEIQTSAQERTVSLRTVAVRLASKTRKRNASAASYAKRKKRILQKKRAGERRERSRDRFLDIVSCRMANSARKSQHALEKYVNLQMFKEQLIPSMPVDAVLSDPEPPSDLSPFSSSTSSDAENETEDDDSSAANGSSDLQYSNGGEDGDQIGQVPSGASVIQA